MSTLQAQQIREVFTYARKFRNNIFVIYIDDLLLKEPYLMRLVNDILHLLDIGIQILIVTGAKNTIKETLIKYKRDIVIKNNRCIVSQEDIELVQLASFDTSVRLINAFAKCNQVATIGNWTTARGIGIIDGIDFEHAGIVEKIDSDAILRMHEDNIIPVFPAIGWSVTGKSYSLESMELAAKISSEVGASKLFYLMDKNPEHIFNELSMQPSEYIDFSDDGTVRRIMRDGAQQIVRDNQAHKNSLAFQLLTQSINVLSKGIERVHLLNATEDGCLLEEMFSNLGIGLMIHNDEYQAIVSLQVSELDEVLSLMQPMMAQGVLLERTIDTLQASYQDYVLYKVDGDIYGFAALHKLDHATAEIAAVVVKQNYNKSGVGRKIISYLIERGKTLGYKQIITFTKSTGDWFENLGFVQVPLCEVPEIRRNQYLAQKRGSRIYKYDLE